MSSPNENQNFIVWQGDTMSLRFEIVGLAPDAAATITWTCATSVPGTVVIQKTAAGSGIANLTTTTLDVLLIPSDTATLSPATYQHELRMVDSSTDRAVVATGTLTLNPSLTP